MDIRKDIEEVLQIMEEHNLKKIAVKKKDFEVHLEKEGCQPMMMAPAPVAHHEAPAAPAPAAPKEEGGKFITSPIVGTFYSAPSPDDPAYVKVGDHVEANMVVCIVEAMKVMNEVKGLESGKVTEILVKNGDPVEFGTKLFKLS